MSGEARIRYLLAAATRADEEGHARVARLLRRMADEARPLDVGELLPTSPRRLDVCPE